MSNNKRVWVGQITCEQVKNLGYGMSFPNGFDFNEYDNIRKELFIKSDLAEYQDTDEFKELQKRSRELRAKYGDFHKINRKFKKPTVLPESLWRPRDDDRELPTQSDYLFEVLDGALILNEKCATIFKQFNLGETTLTPLKIHKLNTDELWLDDTFYFLNLCEQRQYVTKNQDTNYFRFSPNYLETGTHILEADMKENLLQVDSSATQCDVDLWHDPLYRESIFFSDRLRAELIKAKLHKKWRMRACKMV